jgi:hypothetical protein
MRSIRGAVIDGACRDAGQARELGFPVFARAQVPVTARGRLRQKSAAAPVRLGQVTVKPADVAMADEGGVVVIPRERAGQVLDAARGVRAREEQIETEVRAGVPLPHGHRGVGDQALAALDDSAVGLGHVDEVVGTDERDAERDRGDRCRHPARTPSYVGQGQAATHAADQQQWEPDEQFRQGDEDWPEQRDGDQEEQACFPHPDNPMTAVRVPRAKLAETS